MSHAICIQFKCALCCTFTIVRSGFIWYIYQYFQAACIAVAHMITSVAIILHLRVIMTGTTKHKEAQIVKIFLEYTVHYMYMMCTTGRIPNGIKIVFWFRHAKVSRVCLRWSYFSRLPFFNICGCIGSTTSPFEFRWLKGYICNPSDYYHQSEVFTSPIVVIFP